MQGLHGGLEAVKAEDQTWRITGRLKNKAGGLRWKPPAEAWDFSGHSLFSIRITNRGKAMVWVEARIENGGAVDWAHNSMSQAYLLPGETGTLTIGYPLGANRDDSPASFQNMAAKPNGWRSHWKPFNPQDIKSCRIVVRSADPEIKLAGVKPFLAWPYGSDNNRALLASPYLDRFGQPIVFDWPGKIKDETGLIAQRKFEAKALNHNPGPGAFNKFGGFAHGPKRKATGFFRTEKVDGKWWLIDPEGRLFWSHGSCSVNHRSATPTWGPRRALFDWLPEKGTPAFTAGLDPSTGRVDSLRINTMRKYGDDWEETSHDIIHRRMRAWGLNTLGAWSDEALYDDQRTPFTEIVHVWHGPRSIDGAADPYDPGFEQRHRESVQVIADKHRDNPWMIGLFINNEVHWHNDMIEKIIERGPKQPAYRAFVAFLQKQYKSLEKLNTAWDTSIEDWQKLSPGKTKSWQKDRNAFYKDMAERYYRACRKAMDDLLPNHLYLGSRVHSCPPVVADVIAKYVDVFSINHYQPLAGVGRLPKWADKPVMITEFHFGTIDRGVLGMSLCPVHDQKQRTRSYATYVTSGLMHPNVVGTHWFAYADQSAVGRPGECYQIGLVDITDTVYPEITAMTRAIGERMYKLRMTTDRGQLLNEVERLIRSGR